MPTIQSAEKAKTLPANERRGELVVWSVTVQTPEGPRTAELLRKPESPAPTGEVTLEDGPHGLKAKLVQQGGPGGGGKSYEADARGLRGRNASMAVSYAKDLVIADKVPLDQLSRYADAFYSFIEKHARVDS